MNGLLANDANRKALMDVAGARRAALADWQQLAGDIPVDWALANREEIEEAARLRREVDALGAISATAPDVSEDVTGDLAHVLVTRLAEVRSAGGEGVPLVLDDPFRDLDPSVKPMLLELLGRSAGEPQIVFLTEDEDVASWARLEALTGEVALIEPAPEHDEVRLDDEHATDVAIRALGSPPGQTGRLPPMEVRLATLDDAEAIRQIYNLEVTTSTATFDLVPRSLEDQRAWQAERSGARAVLVAELDGEVCGFGSLSPWRDRPAYATTVEDSVYVHRDHQGQGVGHGAARRAGRPPPPPTGSTPAWPASWAATRRRSRCTSAAGSRWSAPSARWAASSASGSTSS